MAVMKGEIGKQKTKPSKKGVESTTLERELQKTYTNG